MVGAHRVNPEKLQTKCHELSQHLTILIADPSVELPQLAIFLSNAASDVLDDANVSARISDETFARLLRKFIEADGSVFSRVKAALIAAIQGAAFNTRNGDGSAGPFTQVIDAALSKCGMAGLLRTDVQEVADGVVEVAAVSMRVHGQMYQLMLRERA
mgnify:CR=1 FL=1